MRPPITANPANSNNSFRRARSPWNAGEDQLLTNLVKEFGPWRWNRIADRIPGRTGQSCRIRWLNHLNTRVNTQPFTGQENLKLLELHKQYGNRWSFISESFVYRTDNQIRNQFNLLVRNECYESSIPFPFANPCETLNRGMAALSSYTPPPTAIPPPHSSLLSGLGNATMPPQSSLLSGLGNGFAVGTQSADLGGMPIPPFGGGSSVLPRGRSPLTPHPGIPSFGGGSSVLPRGRSPFLPHPGIPPFGGGSSVLPRGRSPFPPHSASALRSETLINILATERTYMMLARRANAQPSPVTQPQQESVVKEQKFFDFMGVGPSE